MKMINTFFNTLKITILGLMLVQFAVPSEAEAQVKNPPKERISKTTNKPIKKRGPYITKDGNKVLKYRFNNKLQAVGVMGTTKADLMNVKLGSPAYKKMLQDKKREKTFRAKINALRAQRGKPGTKPTRVSSAAMATKFTSDDESLPSESMSGQEAAPAGDEGAGTDVDALMDQIDAAAQEMDAESEDTDSNPEALEKILDSTMNARESLQSSGDEESVAALDSFENTIIEEEETVETTIETEEGFDLPDEE